MSEAQNRAVSKHRRRLKERGLARYEVRGLACDKELVREFAKRLAANDECAARLRRQIAADIADTGVATVIRTGKDLWEALRRSPLVGLDLDLAREFTTGRDIDL